VKYVYYRYCTEREHGQSEAADAVLHGLGDALLGRFGGLSPRRRRVSPVLRWLFESARRYRSGAVT
jgi:hypothetical protein